MDVAAATRRQQPCLLSSRSYPDFEDGSCDFINTSIPPAPPPSTRPLCLIPCAHRDFETILVKEQEKHAAVRDHRARVAKERALNAGAVSLTSQSTSSSAATASLPKIVVHIDDIGRITRRKVPFVRPIVWNVWDPDAPSFAYETLGLVMRDSLFPGWTYNYDRRGTTQDSFTDEQFRRRYAMTDKYRRRKDEMTMWAEIDIKDKALIRDWNETFEPNGFRKKSK